MCDLAANTDHGLLEHINRSGKTTAREEMFLFYTLLAGIHLEIWVQVFKSLIVKLECVLQKD